VAGGHCYISLQSAPKPPRHSTTPGKSLSQQQQLSASGGYAAAIDYKAECEALLGELQRLLSHAGTDKRWLIKVRVLYEVVLRCAWSALCERLLQKRKGGGSCSWSNTLVQTCGEGRCVSVSLFSKLAACQAGLQACIGNTPRPALWVQAAMQWVMRLGRVAAASRRLTHL
jgi:hypothetical protein